MATQTLLFGLARFHCGRHHRRTGGDLGGDESAPLVRLRVEFMAEVYAFATNQPRDALRRVVCWELNCLASHGYLSQGFHPVGRTPRVPPMA